MLKCGATFGVHGLGLAGMIRRLQSLLLLFPLLSHRHGQIHGVLKMTDTCCSEDDEWGMMGRVKAMRFGCAIALYLRETSEH